MENMLILIGLFVLFAIGIIGHDKIIERRETKDKRK